MKTVIGMGVAVGGSCLFGIGAALQALEARAVPRAHALHVSLLRRLVARPRWLLGSLLAGLSWPIHAAAMTLAPLAVVQAADSVGLLVLLAIATRVLGERVGPREWTAAAGIVTGVAALVLLAPARSVEHASPRELMVPLLVLGLAALGPYVLRARASKHGLSIALGAGLAFAWTAFATKLIADHVDQGTLAPLLFWIPAAALLGLLGVLGEASALQRRAATQVIPAIYVIELVVPVFLAFFLGGERPGTALEVAGLCAALALLAGSVARLGGSRSLAGLAAH